MQVVANGHVILAAAWDVHDDSARVQGHQSCWLGTFLESARVTNALEQRALITSLPQCSHQQGRDTAVVNHTVKGSSCLNVDGTIVLCTAFSLTSLLRSENARLHRASGLDTLLCLAMIRPNLMAKFQVVSQSGLDACGNAQPAGSTDFLVLP